MPKIDFAVTCQKCASQLSGMDSDGVCPTCERAIAETVDDRILDLSTGTVAVDFACAECFYNLRTLSFNTLCPECGTPVLKSLGVEELRLCNPLWLRKVRRGLTIVLITVLVSIVVGALGVVAIALLTGIRWGPPTSMEFWFMLLSMIGYALVIISVFYITTPKPHEPENDPTNRVGRITRVLVLASSALSLVGVLMVDPYAMPTGGSIGRWNLLLGIVQSLLFGGATIGAVIVLARIAILGRRRGLRKLGRVLAWFVGFHVLGQIVVSGYTFFVLPSIATGMLASQSAATSTSTSVGVGYVTTVTIGGNTPGTSGQGTNAAGPAGSNAQTTSPAALPPGAGAVPATPVPAMGSFAGLAVFGCFSAIVTVGTFVLGLTVLVKYRNLLGSAITASVTSARCRPLPQHGPTV